MVDFASSVESWKATSPSLRTPKLAMSILAAPESAPLGNNSRGDSVAIPNKQKASKERLFKFYLLI
jgi:hypothetical protein